MAFVFKSDPTRSYSFNFSCLNLVLLNPDFTIYRNWKSKQGDIYKFDFTSNEKNIILRYGFSGKISLVKFDLDLNILKKKELDSSFQYISSNDSIICFFKDGINNELYKFVILDWELNLTREEGQSDFPTGSYYFVKDKPKNIFLDGSKMFVLYQGFVDVLDIETGNRLKTIKTKVDKIKTDSNQNLYFWQKSQSKISRYNSELVYLDEIQIDANCEEFVVEENGRFMFFKKN